MEAPNESPISNNKINKEFAQSNFLRGEKWWVYVQVGTNKEFHIGECFLKSIYWKKGGLQGLQKKIII